MAGFEVTTEALFRSLCQAFGAMLPAFQPLAVIPRQYPFDGSDWVFELKYHGFRALAYL